MDSDDGIASTVLDAERWRDVPTDCAFVLDYAIDKETRGNKKPYRTAGRTPSAMRCSRGCWNSTPSGPREPRQAARQFQANGRDRAPSEATPDGWLHRVAFGRIIRRMNPTREPVPVDRKIKHLEFIQGVINRLASDSFRLKGWSVVLVSALFVLSAREGRLELVSTAFVPVFVFWGLDGYFLWQERLFRALYDHVRVLAEDRVDFSMDVRAVGTGRAPTWLGATFSRTLLSFYVALAAAVCLTMAIG